MRSATFIAVLTVLDQAVDPGLTVHLVLDDGSSHISDATEKWLREHPRFQPRCTPAPRYPSWSDRADAAGAMTG